LFAMLFSVGSVQGEPTLSPGEAAGAGLGAVELTIDGSSDFDILSSPGLSFSPLTREASLDVIGPLICFSRLDAPSDAPILLSINDANGDQVVDRLPLDRNIQFLPQTARLSVQTPDRGFCFYTGPLGFGLSGMRPGEREPGDLVFADRFESKSQLDVEFVDVPSFVRPGELVQYQILLSNDGTLSATTVGFQELYPRNPTFFPDGQLTAGVYQCQPLGGADCADATPDLDTRSIRGQTLSLAPDATIIFDVSRIVSPSSVIGGQIDLLAAAVARNQLTFDNWDADTATMTIIGEGQSIVATIDNQNPPIADGVDEAAIRVIALDEFKNPTPDVAVQVSNADGLSFVSSNGLTGADGSIVFLARTVGAEAAGSYTPEFLAPDIGANGSTAQVTVEFVAGEPDQFSAFTVTGANIADGQDRGVIELSVSDALNNPAEGAEVIVLNEDGLDFIESSVVTDEFGVATFQMSTTTSGTYTPLFAQASIGLTGGTITFEAGAAEALEFITQPSDSSVGMAIDPPVVLRIVDAFGNRVDSDNSSAATAQLRQIVNGNDSAVAFFDDVTAINGIVTLDDLTVDTAGADYYLRIFSDYPIVTSNLFEVFPVVP